MRRRLSGEGVIFLIWIKVSDLIAQQERGCYNSQGNRKADCTVVNQEQAIAKLVKEKQDQVYKDKCAELAGTNAFYSCNTPDLAKQYLVTVMNPDLSQDKAKELASKLDPSFDTAAQLAAEKQYQSWKTFDTAKGVVGGLSADVAALIWNPVSAVGNSITGNWYNSHKDFMTFNNPFEVDQNALKLKAQEEITTKLYSTKGSVYENPEKAAEIEMASKLGFLNNPKMVEDVRKRVESGASNGKEKQITIGYGVMVSGD
jgi:hypothetical protein